MPNWKLKIKGSGAPPAVPSAGSKGDSFNAPAGQYGGEANGRLKPWPSKGTMPGQPNNPDTGQNQGAVKKRAHFPAPRSSRNTGRTLKT
jgi:hypothetical protein